MSILYNVHVIAARTDQLLSSAISEMSSGDFALYSLLKTLGPLTPGEISRRHGSAPSSTSVSLQRLEEAGHIRRTPHPTDSRTFFVTLTELGEEAHEKARTQFMDVLRPLLENLGGDVDTIRWALRRLAGALADLQGLTEIEGVPALPGPTPNRIDYDGLPLTAAEERTVREQIDFLRWRRDR